MFGYRHGELVGERLEAPIPVGLRAAHVRHRADYDREPRARPMGAGARLVGLRKDGATFPVQISLRPVPTATGRFTLAVVRDVTGTSPRADLADLAWDAAAAEETRLGRELLDRVVTNLYDVGLSLKAAVGLPHDAAGHRIIRALHRLDDTIREIRDHVSAATELARPPGHGLGNETS